jgi:hypothetical protein
MSLLKVLISPTTTVTKPNDSYKLERENLCLALQIVASRGELFK